MTQILGDTSLWGPDFPSLLAQLEGLQRSNQQLVILFPDRAMLGTSFKTEAEAGAAATTVDRALADLRNAPTANYRRLQSRGAVREFKAQVIPQFPEDRTARVVLAPAALLPQNLTVATVRTRLGAPQRTTRELVEGPGESRPLVLTLYSYADGAIVYAEADIAPRPGFVNRVRVNISAAIAALGREQ